MMRKRMLCALVLATLLTGCVDQSTPRIIATSRATAEICDLLELPLVAVTESTLKIPARYANLPTVGSAMSPDYERVAALKPTDVIGPDTLREQLEQNYQKLGLPYTFLSLRSVQGLYDGIELLGTRYQAQERAGKLVHDYQTTIEMLRRAREGKKSPTVLLLMGFPGAYSEATASSYIGDLVSLAGGVNVVTSDTEDFVNWNTEQLLALNPDYILWTAHAMPQQVADMFAKEFAQNDVWKHFDAVRKGRVVQLDDTLFHMSANMRWKEALAFLYQLFYGVSLA